MPRTKAKNLSVTEETPIIEKKMRPGKILLLVGLVILLGFLAWQNKSLFIVATVDNTPIWRFAFEKQILKNAGDQTLQSMIDEQILLSEASKRGVTVSPEEVSAKISEIEKTLPEGSTLADVLATEGMTTEDLRNRVTLQITVEKLAASLPPPSTEELSKFIADNKEFLTATDEAGLTQEAKQALADQKLQQLFEDLKEKAKVTKFL